MPQPSRSMTEFEAQEFERRLERLRALPSELAPVDQLPWDPSAREVLFGQLDSETLPDLENIRSGALVRVLGRIQTIRTHGKIAFVSVWVHGNVQSKLVQLVFKQDETTYFKELDLLDLGDMIFADGIAFKTMRGEPSVLVRSWRVANKSLRQWPEKWHGLEDHEMRLRKRYAALATDLDTLHVFRTRFTLLSFIRQRMQEAGFIEVETPILSAKSSGALATPFVTTQAATKTDWFLRIAPETFLKQLIVGGMDRVFEIARCFRNEGIDPTHLPEFTMLEYYVAGWNWSDNLSFTATMLRDMFFKVHPSGSFERNGQHIDFSGEWPVVSFSELFEKIVGERLYEPAEVGQKLRSRDFFIALAHKHHVIIDETSSVGALVDSIYKKLIRSTLIQPIVITGHPIELKPLARRNAESSWLADSYQIIIDSQEVVNAYSELADAVDQRARLIAQNAAREAGDAEAMPLDESFLEALEHGMPPVSGTGIGIDRLCALLCDQDNLRDVILFPLMRSDD